MILGGRFCSADPSKWSSVCTLVDILLIEIQYLLTYCPESFSMPLRFVVDCHVLSISCQFIYYIYQWLGFGVIMYNFSVIPYYFRELFLNIFPLFDIVGSLGPNVRSRHILSGGGDVQF